MKEILIEDGAEKGGGSVSFQKSLFLARILLGVIGSIAMLVPMSFLNYFTDLALQSFFSSKAIIFILSFVFLKALANVFKNNTPPLEKIWIGWRRSWNKQAEGREDFKNFKPKQMLDSFNVVLALMAICLIFLFKGFIGDVWSILYIGTVAVYGAWLDPLKIRDLNKAQSNLD